MPNSHPRPPRYTAPGHDSGSAVLHLNSSDGDGLFVTAHDVEPEHVLIDLTDWLRHCQVTGQLPTATNYETRWARGPHGNVHLQRVADPERFDRTPGVWVGIDLHGNYLDWEGRIIGLRSQTIDNDPDRASATILTEWINEPISAADLRQVHHLAADAARYRIATHAAPNTAAELAEFSADLDKWTAMRNRHLVAVAAAEQRRVPPSCAAQTPAGEQRSSDESWHASDCGGFPFCDGCVRYHIRKVADDRWGRVWHFWHDLDGHQFGSKATFSAAVACVNYAIRTGQ